ncbi:MAG: hypothetical protein IPK72_21475 [Candidatus Eisenbacteria bacterium]|nr:hypothetical protein [Candidatus Eisenbacteria bacterium]
MTSLHRGGFTIEIGIGVKDVGKRGGDLIGGELDRLRVGAGVAGQDTIAERGVDAVEVTGVDEATEEAARDGPVVGRGDERLQLRETPGRGIEELGGAGTAHDLDGGELRTMVGRQASASRLRTSQRQFTRILIEARIQSPLSPQSVPSSPENSVVAQDPPVTALEFELRGTPSPRQP